MKAEDFRLGAEKLSRENKFFRMLIPLLAGSLLLMSIAVFQTSQTIVVVPPQITEQMTISLNKADENYKRTWAMFAAGIIGNVNPGNVALSTSTIEGLVSSEVLPKFKELLAEQVKIIKKKNLNISFAPQSVSYHAYSDRVYVYGNKKIIGMGGKSIVEDTTFEFEISVKNYKPQIKFMNIYKGRPQTPVVDE